MKRRGNKRAAARQIASCAIGNRTNKAPHQRNFSCLLKSLEGGASGHHVQAALFQSSSFDKQHFSHTARVELELKQSSQSRANKPIAL